ncbi:MAG: hypothetical protein ACP5UZ_07200 [Thermoplasmata archaeon]
MSENAKNSGKQLRQASIIVNSIYCISCSRVFASGLRKIHGVSKVEEFPITNKFRVTFDPSLAEEQRLREELLNLAERSGLKDQIIIRFS